jgi:branched-subunit amino acid transport protein
MMWIGILVGALGCYILKLLGLSVPERILANPYVQRISVLLPVALLTALMATQTFSTSQQLDVGAPAAGVTAAFVALLLRAPFLIVIAVAAVVTGALHAVL